MKQSQSTELNWINKKQIALLTDFYQLTMLNGYHKNNIANNKVCFNYFFRSLPLHNGYAIFAGLEQFIRYLENLNFTDDDLSFLSKNKLFDNDFIHFLRDFKLDLDIFAVDEGTIVFPHEPIIRVEGSLAQAQLIETFLLNTINFQTLIATKAARICHVAGDEPVMEFGLRRAQGPDGALSASRASYIGGCTSTSNVLAGKIYDIPLSGTQAHSWIMSFDDELTAFRKYAEIFPDNCVLLVDTYNTLSSGVPNAIKVFRELHEKGQKVRFAIRLDSGDLAKLSKKAYEMITSAGFENPLIVASNDLDEELIADIKRQKSKINAWGVGTNLVTSKEHPALGGVYKLAAVYDDSKWIPKMKISSNVGKMTDPGRKNIIRLFNGNSMIGDIISSSEEDIKTQSKYKIIDRDYFYKTYCINNINSQENILKQFMTKGKIDYDFPRLSKIQEFVKTQLKKLPEEYKRLKFPEIYKVGLSANLAKIKEEFIKMEQ